MTVAVAAAALGPRHTEVKRLRALLRDPRGPRRGVGVRARRSARSSPTRSTAGATLDAIYLGPNARHAFARCSTDAAVDAGVPVFELKEGVLEKLGSTRTPQPVLAVAPMPPRRGARRRSTADGPVLVAVGVSDPGNLGTLVRSAEAAGAPGVVCCGRDRSTSYNPKVVRASAGSVFGVPIVVVGRSRRAAAATTLGATGCRRVRRRSADGGARRTTDVDLTRAGRARARQRGARPARRGARPRSTSLITIPMAGAAESLNVAMAGSILLFEAAAPAPRR